MPPRKSGVKSQSQSVQAVLTHMETISKELAELRAKPTDESLMQRVKVFEADVLSLAEFKLSLENLCERFQHDMDDLFSDNLWQSMLFRCTRYSTTYNDTDVVAST